MSRPLRLVPPAVLMAAIFALSAQPDLNSGLGTIDFIGRKMVHMAEYGLLWFLLLRAFDHEHPLRAAAIAIAYAGSDELHQSFVDGRHGTPVDVLIDAAGIGVAALLLRARRRPSAHAQAHL